MSNFAAQRSRYQNATKSAGFKKNSYGGNKRFAEIRMQAIERNTTLAMRPLMVVPGKVNEFPLCFSRLRIETVRKPEICAPKTDKDKERLDFSTHNEWCLDASSYTDEDEAPTAVSTFLETAQQCGFLVEGEGFKHPSKVVNEALQGLIPWTQFMFAVLVRAERQEVSRNVVGENEYINYTLIPHKNPDYSTWTPVIFIVDNDRWMGKFFEQADAYCDANGLKSINGRKNGPLMMFQKNDKGHYDVSFQKDKGGEIPQELWKSLAEDMPDIQARMDKIKMTDDEILDAFSRAWWWKKTVDHCKPLGEVFTAEDATEWADDEDEEEDEESSTSEEELEEDEEEEEDED